MSATVKVDICQLPHGEGLALPAYQSADAAGLDLLAAVPADTPLILPPGKYAMVPTGLTIALPPGYEAQVRPRSGLAAKHGVTVLNSPGTVDADYRGEINVLLINHGEAPFPIRRGERIAQMVIAPVVQAQLVPGRHRCRRPTAAAAASARPGADQNSIKNTELVRKIRFRRFRRAFFTAGFAFTIWTLTGRLPKGILSTRFVHGGGKRRACSRAFLGQIMSGVVAAMRRNLLSCTSLARHGLIALATALTALPEPAVAGDLTITQAISAWLDLNHQEFAALTTALSLVGFTVVAAILLMRTRIRATRTELRLRTDIADLQVQADRLRALLFAEPQILIAWAAGDNRPQISGDTSLLISQDAQLNSPQRILAFGTWLPPEPALQMDHAVDALREAGEGFLLNLSTSNGRAIEAMGRAIGGQAIVRIRELGGLRRELAESNLRYRTLQEETELLRDFAAAAPWPIWAKSAEGNLRYANAAYVRATEGGSVADAIHRNLELLENDQRAEMSRVLNDNSSFSARLPIVVGGERRIYDVQALRLNTGSAGIAIDASEATALRDAMERMAEAHRRTLDQLSSGVAVFDGSAAARLL